ncbi:MAG: hypothetical protein JXB45_12430 [Candidatus Krumholzibacteriota bacterium]|nr:hypothetical protein [Candidatus Krumholzibacteriota bacterium]
MKSKNGVIFLSGSARTFSFAEPRPGSPAGPGKGRRGHHRSPAALCLILFVLLIMPPTSSSGQSSHRINAALLPVVYVFDSNYFGLNNAAGVDLALRYELCNNFFFENRLGTFISSSDGTTVGGFNGQVGGLVLLPYLIPYRPLLRASLGLLSSNPITVTPTETYRPTQTTFYLIGGGGITAPLLYGFAAELNINIMFTPYKYMIYEFDRTHVKTRERQFTHLSFTLGVFYEF